MFIGCRRRSASWTLRSFPAARPASVLRWLRRFWRRSLSSSQGGGARSPGGVELGAGDLGKLDRGEAKD